MNRWDLSTIRERTVILWVCLYCTSLLKMKDGYDLVLYIDPLLTELADELGRTDD
jgi:hypothetical protein